VIKTGNPKIATKAMKKNRSFLTILFFIFFALLSTGCTGRSLTASSWPGLLTTQDTAYVAFNSHVYAVNIATGTLKWQYPSEADRNLTFFASPVDIGDGRIIVGDYSNSLHLINETTGQEVGTGGWPFDEAGNRYIAGPLVTDIGIFAPSADGNLYALDAQGSTLWEPFETGGDLWAKPALDGDRLFLPSMDHNLYALDARTGKLYWSEDLDGALAGSPAVSDDGIVYIGSFANELVALKTETGDILWRTPTNDWVWAGPALDGDVLYFGDVSGMLYGVNRSDGGQLWTYQADGTIAGRPLVTEDTLYITTDAGSLIALTKDGAVKWTQAVGGKLYSSPAIVDDKILVTAVEAETLLSAYTINGAQAWSFNPES
jgi:outer membrane protein assembly factor BamB